MRCSCPLFQGGGAGSGGSEIHRGGTSSSAGPHLRVLLHSRAFMSSWDSRVGWGSLACAEAAGQGQRSWPQAGDQAPGPRVCALKRRGLQGAQEEAGASAGAGLGAGHPALLSPGPESGLPMAFPEWRLVSGQPALPWGLFQELRRGRLAVMAANYEPATERQQAMWKRAHTPLRSPWVKGDFPKEAATRWRSK